MYKRICPNCNKELFYKSKESYWFCNKANTVCRICAHLLKYPNYKKGSVLRLNEESYDAYYWLGFICADGHISNGVRLNVTLSLKDTNHLKKLAIFLGGCPIRIEKQCSLAIMDSINIKKVVEKYSIVSNKTKNPINFDSVKGFRNKIAFIAGFIDGDGCIGNLHNRKDFNLRVKCHSSWLEVLNKINKIIGGKNEAKINKQGYALFSIGDSRKLKQLKRVILQLNLPILERKWKIIDLNFIGKYEKTSINIKKIRSLVLKGKTQKEIVEILGLSPTAVSLLIKRNKIKYERIKHN